MTEAQRHILERHLQAARVQVGMSVEESWALLERKLVSGPSRPSRRFGFLGLVVVVALLLLVGATYRVVMQPASTAPTDHGPVSAGSPTNTDASTGSRDDARRSHAGADTTGSTGGSNEFRARDVARSSGDSDRRPVGRTRGLPPPRARKDGAASSSAARSTPSDALEPLITESESADSMLSRAAEAFWHRELEGYRAAFDRMMSPEDRDSLERLRMRFERIGQDLEVKWSAGRPFDTAAAHDEVMAIYIGLGRMAPRYPAIVGDYRDSLVEAFRAFGAMLDSTASVRRALVRPSDDASIAYDTLLARIARMRTDLATILANEEQVRNMYGMGMLPTILLYHGEELASVLAKFESTMAVFVETPETTELVGFGALPARAVVAPSRARGASATVEIALPQSAAGVEVRIVDAQGDVVARTSLGRRPAGAHRENIPIGALAAGEYLLVVDAGYSDIAPVYATTLSIER